MLLKTKIIASASAALVILGGSLLALSSLSLDRAEARYREAMLRQTQTIWQQITAAQIGVMKNNIKGLTRNREAIEALESNIIEDIEDETASTFNRLTASNVIESLKIFNAKGELKYAEPVIEGAAATPALVTDALAQGKPQSGLIEDMDGRLVLAVAFPLYQKGALIGVGVYARSLMSALDDFKSTDGSEAFVVKSGASENLGTAPELFASLSVAMPPPGRKIFSIVSHNSYFYAVSEVPLISAHDAPVGHLVAIIDKTESYKEQQFFENAAKVGLVLIFVFAIAGLNLFLRYNFKAFGTMIEALNSLAQGDTGVNVQGAERKDEIGDISRAVLIFRDNAIEKERLEEEENKTAAENQRRAEAERARIDRENAEKLARQERIEALTAGFGSTVEEILAVVVSSSSEMETSARSMSEIAKQTQDESTIVASAAEETTANVQTVSAATEELSSSISEISRQVAHSAEISGKAVESAEASNQTVRDLAEAAQRIGDVVDMINDIANQTNLLALNATIEAARAGEAGKGFAVVASEVKNLASQTAKATEDIGVQISGIQSTTQEAVSAIEGIGLTISEMNEIATTIAAAVEEQGAATDEISRSVQDVASGTQNVAKSIVTVKAGSEQTGEASGVVLTASRELSERFQGLRTEVEKFLTNINAA